MEIVSRKTANGSEGEFDFRGYPQHNIWEIMQDLWITPDEMWEMTGKKILFIGGAETPMRAQFASYGINPEITNMDMYFDADEKNAHHHIKADFFEHPPMLDEFDYVLLDYSLPLYALTEDEAAGFFALAALYLKPGGKFRAFPMNGGDPERLVGVPEGYDLGKIQKASYKGMKEIAEILRQAKLEGAVARAELNPVNITDEEYIRMRNPLYPGSISPKKFGLMLVEINKAMDLAKREIEAGRPFDGRKLAYLENLQKYSCTSFSWCSGALILQCMSKAKRAVIAAPNTAEDKAKFNELMLGYAARRHIPAAMNMR